MLKIRLQRVGRKHEPSFRLVLTDSKNSTKSGRFGELLGSYDARKTTEAFNGERIKYWLSRGVSLTPSVNNLLIKKGVIRGKKINVSNVMKGASVQVAEETVAPEAVAEVAPEAVAEPATQEPAPEV